MITAAENKQQAKVADISRHNYQHPHHNDHHGIVHIDEEHGWHNNGARVDESIVNSRSSSGAVAAAVAAMVSSSVIEMDRSAGGAPCETRSRRDNTVPDAPLLDSASLLVDVCAEDPFQFIAGELKICS